MRYGDQKILMIWFSSEFAFQRFPIPTVFTDELPHQEPYLSSLSAAI